MSSSSFNNNSTTTNDAAAVVAPKQFTELLYEMLMTDGREGGCCEWMYNGKAFKINKDHPDLDDVIRKYWRHGNLKSLLRQMNTYGFKKGFKGETYSNATYHPSFQRGKTELLKGIKRRPPAGRAKQNKEQKQQPHRQQKQQRQQQQGTRKRKIKNQTTDADDEDDNDGIVREDAVIMGNNSDRAAAKEETYDYDGSDNSTAANDDNSMVGGEQQEDDDEVFEDNTETMEDDQEAGGRGRGFPRNVATTTGTEAAAAGSGNGGVKVLKLSFKGDGSAIPPKEQQQSTNRIILPYALKKLMMKTWENISTQRLVPCLPAPISVRKALDLYVEAKVDYTMSVAYDNYDDPKFIRKKKRGWMDLAEGITVFFDKALPTRLLYREELPQLKAIQQQQQQQQQSTDGVNQDENNDKSDDSDDDDNNNNSSFKNKRLSEIYGCEYLLRMLLRLPDILSECVPDEDTRKRILQDMVEFVRFLHQHKDVLFATSFRKLTLDEIK